MELLLLNFRDGTLIVLSGDGIGGFAGGRRDYALGVNPLSAQLSDVNLDGHADVVVAHVNTTVAGSIGVTRAAMSLDKAVERVQAMHDAAKAINPEVIVLCHGGPIAHPEDAQYVLDRTRGVAGFFGASSIERLATETAIEEQARRFKGLRLRS